MEGVNRQAGWRGRSHNTREESRMILYLVVIVSLPSNVADGALPSCEANW